MTDTWYPAPALLTLRDETNAAYPDRDRSSDGIIGDASHQAESFSDHNPDWHSLPPGAVRAMDLDSNGPLGVATPLVRDVLAATIGDARVWYVIWDGKIYSRTYGWEARIYTGASRHQEHVHVSLLGHTLGEAAAHDVAFNTTPWHLGAGTVTGDTLPPVRLHRVTDAARHPRREWAPVNVRRVQKAMAARGMKVTVNGIYDHATRTAYRTWQQRLGYRGHDADGLPGTRTLTLLGANRFRVLP